LNGASLTQTTYVEPRAVAVTTRTAQELQSATLPASILDLEEPSMKREAGENKEKESSAAPENEPTPSTMPVEKGTEEQEPSTEGEVTTQEILSVWNQVRTEVKLRMPKTEALLNSQKMIQMKHGTLILGFQSEVVRSKMENPENIELTRRVIYNLLHKDVAIECIVISGKRNDGGIDSSYESDSLVNAAIHLGGKLVHKD